MFGEHIASRLFLYDAAGLPTVLAGFPGGNTSLNLLIDRLVYAVWSA